MPELQPVQNENLAVKVYRTGKRIIVRRGKSFVPVVAIDIALCYSVNKVTFVQTFRGGKYVSDNSLSDLMLMLDHVNFFRLNRSIIVNIDAILEFRSVEFSKIRVELIPLNNALTSVTVSQFTSPSFRKWIGEKQ
jgi:DNA-binding LytR/AlgR family response regulator